MSNDHPKYEAIETIMEFLIDYDKRYVTPDVIQAGTNLEPRRVVEGVRRLITYYNVMRYNRHGEYEILDLEKFFDDPEPGCNDRYHRRYLTP